MVRLNFFDVLVFVLLMAVSVWAALRLRGDRASVIMIETPEGSYCYPLTRDASYLFQGRQGAFSIEVRNSVVKVVDTCCPEKTCMNYSISRPGQTIVCLPNRISVCLESAGEVDEIAY